MRLWCAGVLCYLHMRYSLCRYGQTLFATKRHTAAMHNTAIDTHRHSHSPQIVVTTRQYARGVCAIDGAWLPELAPAFFTRQTMAGRGMDDGDQ